MTKTIVEVKESKGPGDMPNLEFIISRGVHRTLVGQFFDKDGRCTDITRRTERREEHFQLLDLTLTKKE